MSTLSRLVPTREEGNTLYPLPPDYLALSDEGQRQARVNGCRQWLLHRDDRFARARAMVASYHLFVSHYLAPEVDEGGEVVFDPLWYDSWLPKPPHHYLLSRNSVIYDATATIAPRGTAKTFWALEDFMLRALSCPAYLCTYVTSIATFAEERGDKMKYQLYNNQRIVDDWSPEYGGAVKPTKGEAKMGMESFSLTNRSGIASFGCGGSLRGPRPRRIRLDDIEDDPTGATDTEELRSWAETLVFRILLPMVQRAETGIDILGTFVSPRLYLRHIMEVEPVVIDGITYMKSTDPRFEDWHRQIIPAVYRGTDGLDHSCWPHMWPIDDAEKEKLGLHPETKTIPTVRKRVGEEVWAPEYMGQPAPPGSGTFPRLTPDSHGYRIEKADALLPVSPCLSNTELSWVRGGQTVRMSLRDFCSRFPRAVTVDTSWTEGPDSDFKVAACWCLTDHNELFVLDLWGEQTGQSVLVQQSFLMADRWLASVISPELVKAGYDVERELKMMVATRAQDVMGVKHLPTIAGFNPGVTDKCTKITTALKWRFDHGLVKLPLARSDWPWRELFSQISGFNHRLRDGGLKKDDFLDTVSMQSFVVSGVPLPPPGEEKPKSPKERLMAGERIDEKTGQPLVNTAFYSMSPDELIAACHTPPPAGDRPDGIFT